MEGLCTLAGKLTPTTPGDWAQWAGALGTIVAAMWAAWTYWNDRKRSREDADEARHLSSWRQAALIRGHLALAKAKLAAISQSVNDAKPPNSVTASGVALTISAVDHIASNLDNVTAFGMANSAALLRFVSKCQVANEMVRARYTGVSSEEFNSLRVQINWGPAQVAEWRALAGESTRLYDVFNAIAEAVPVH